jgi:hypothetical protein
MEVCLLLHFSQELQVPSGYTLGEIDDAVAARDTHNVIARRLPGRGERKQIWWRCPVPDCPARKRAVIRTHVP